MLNKKIVIAIISLIFIIITICFIPHDKTYRVTEIKSPTHLILDKTEIHLKDFETFDSTFSNHNKKLSKILNISETEAFILGNLAKQWASNLMLGREVLIKNDSDLIFSKCSYRDKFANSGFCISNNKPCSQKEFNKQLRIAKSNNIKILDLDNETFYPASDNKIKTLENTLVIRNYSHFYQKVKFNKIKPQEILTKGDIKIYFADLTTKNFPDRNCSSQICKEILSNINNAKNNIDIAIYGYSRVPEIETALQNALNRGVKIRLVYDLNSKGENIYPDTPIITKLLTTNISDIKSSESQNIMHNKFYVFDNIITITGSANLSHTDMSGFNSNSIVIINSEEIANIYKKEFEQMFYGKFHSDKTSHKNKTIKFGETQIQPYFSPQDKSITNAILPLIKGAKKYIYIPTFILTEKRVTEELIRAKKRGVDVKIIIDALNASIKHSKHNILRAEGVPVKTENYAGKMHSKSIIIDDQYTIIGSMNFSYSGENKNDENLVVINDTQIAKFYKEFFLYQWSQIDDKWLRFNAKAEGKDSIGSCSDGIDNDYDGLIDSMDESCKTL